MILSPSICTAGYARLGETIAWIEENGCDRIHIDIMDGQFVHPIMGGTDYVNTIRALTKLPVELHFMTYEPEKMLEMYQIREGEIVYIHADTTYHPHRLLQSIRDKGAIPGLALSFYDEPDDALELLGQTAAVLLMGVKAGMPGSAFYWSVLDKCRRIKELGKELGKELPVQVDGSVSPENICRLTEGGTDAVVLGYPGCFDPVRGRDYTLALMKKLIRETEKKQEDKK